MAEVIQKMVADSPKVHPVKVAHPLAGTLMILVLRILQKKAAIALLLVKMKNFPSNRRAKGV
jgi:hypothetical protein